MWDHSLLGEVVSPVIGSEGVLGVGLTGSAFHLREPPIQRPPTERSTRLPLQCQHGREYFPTVTGTGLTFAHAAGGSRFLSSRLTSKATRTVFSLEHYRACPVVVPSRLSSGTRPSYQRSNRRWWCLRAADGPTTQHDPRQGSRSPTVDLEGNPRTTPWIRMGTPGRSASLASFNGG